MGSKAPKPPPLPAPQPLPVYTPPPEPPPVVKMPVPDDKALLAEKKKKSALQAQRTGRASTFLTKDEDDGKLG